MFDNLQLFRLAKFTFQKMKIFAGSWFFSSPINQKIYYPGVGSDSGSWQFAKTYWHCLLTCLYSISRSAKISTLSSSVVPFLCLNSSPPEQLKAQLNYHSFLSEHGISEFFFNPESDVDESLPFATQIHIYEVLKVLYREMSEDDICILLDCDVFCSHFPSESVLESVVNRGYHWFFQSWPSDYSLNGTSPAKLARIMSEEMGINDQSVDKFVGGEIFALTRKSLGSFIDCASAYVYLYNKYSLTEEVLNTALLFKLGWSALSSERLVDRIWTDASKFCNLSSVSLDVPFLHMPAEKQNGFYSFYHDILLQDLGKDLPWPIPSAQIASRFRLA